MPGASVANDVRLANMAQDLELLKTQVANLQLEVKDLQRENRHLRATIAAGAVSGNGTRESFRSYQETMDRKLDDFRRVITSSNEVHKEKLLKEINRKLTDLAGQTKIQFDALAKALSAPQRPASPPSVPHPKTGIVYKVQKGDTLSGIARNNKSKVSWIKTANDIIVDTALQAGEDIFIPQDN
tara:strand:+ start:1793 stop:2344 length:552 start_codon:yes stop_codon:yes gene_type:complete